MGRYQAELKYIGSIYPGDLPPVYRNYGPSPVPNGVGGRLTKYQLKPVPRGKQPCVIELCDCFEEVMGGLAGVQHGSTLPKISKPVPVEQIVQDVLNQWTGGLFNVPQGAKPGIIEIANSVPSQAELKIMEAQQILYFEYLFAEGQRLHKENDWKNLSDTMRLAAKWLGHQTIWSDPAIARDSVPCPLCTQMIPNYAITCMHCGQNVKAMPPELAKLQLAKA